MRPIPGVLIPLIIPLLPLSTAFQCLLTASSITYDINPLSGLRTTDSRTETPPTESEARVRMDLCGDGVGREDGVEDEDQCPSNARVCLKLINLKKGQEERVTSVVPFWMTDTAEDDIWTTPMGSKGQEGLKIWVEGPEYAGSSQSLNLTLLCASSATEPAPRFVSYTTGRLSLEWETPDACPRDGSYSGGDGSGGGDGGRGWGFFGFVKMVFWMLVLGLIGYFAIGIFYNHQQYSARGWDLVPHRDFWREFPVLLQDLFGHVFNNVRQGGSSGRGGYSSLG